MLAGHLLSGRTTRSPGRMTFHLEVPSVSLTTRILRQANMPIEDPARDKRGVGLHDLISQGPDGNEASRHDTADPAIDASAKTNEHPIRPASYDGLRSQA